MGAIASKEQVMAKAIENHDIDALQIFVSDVKREEMHTLCKSLVPANENKCTILHYATWQDNPTLLELLLDYADDLEVRDGLGWTPLMTAVHRNSTENVKILLKRGAKIDSDTVKGRDLIATAMNFNNIELVQILMDHGAQLTNSSDDIYDNNDNSTGCHLLHFAADDGLIDIAQLLIVQGKMPVNTHDQIGWTPLHLAAGHNHLNIIKLLIENGAEINIKDFHGNTPLAWARERNCKEAVDELKKHGGIADDEWHGEKLELSNDKIQREEDEELGGIDNSQFEIEETEDKDSIIPDALQRQN